MKPVTIYTTPFCGYCLAAKRLLRDKGIAFEDADIAREPARRAEMVQRAMGRRSVPQIFIGEVHVGVFDEIYALDRAGKLDPMLGEA
jgi:glutaredoxin 3